MHRTGAQPLLLAGICVLLAAPVLLVHDAPLFDLQVHIARQHILYDDSIAAAREHYQVLWRVLPNLALDLFVGIFRFIMPIDWAVRLFLAVSAIQLFLGAVALNHALFGRQAQFGWYAALLVYNAIFLIGLVNLCFGIGLCLWVFALAIAIRRFWLRFAVCGLLATAILLSHLYAFALYGLLLGAYAGQRALSGRRPFFARLGEIAALLAHLIVPIIFYLVFVPRGFNDFLPVAWHFKEKLWWLTSLLGFYDLTFDMICLLLLIYGLVLLLMRRQIAFTRAMLWPILALAVAFVAMPYQIGQASWVDARVPSFLILVLFASLDWRPGARLRPAVNAIVLGLFVIRTGIMIAEWRSWQPVYQDLHTAFRLMEPGAKLLPVNTHPSDLYPGEGPPVPHFDAIAVTERGAFIPSMLADRPYELLHYTPAAEPLKAAFGTSTQRIADYDYVLVVDPVANGIPEGVSEVFRGRDFILARVIH